MSKIRKRRFSSSTSRGMRTTSNALEIIDHHLIRSDPEMRELVEQATVDALVEQLIYDARRAAKLTQKLRDRLIDAAT